MRGWRRWTIGAGGSDASGRELEATEIAIADEAAAAADLVRDKTSGVPAAVIRGLQRHVTPEDGPGAACPTPPPRTTTSSADQIRRTAAPRRRPARRSSSASFADSSG